MHTPGNPKPTPLRYRRRSPERLARTGWDNGHSIWNTDDTSHPATVDRIAITTEPAPSHIAKALDLTTPTDTVIRRRRYLIDHRPIQHATSYYSGLIAAGTRIAEPDTGPGGVYARLAELGYAPDHFREELHIRPPRTWETTLLNLAPDINVIDVTRTTFTDQGHPVEITQMILDSSAYVLEYNFSANG